MPYWRLFYHIVGATKNREPLIALEWETSLHHVIAAKGTALGAFVHQVNGTDSRPSKRPAHLLHPLPKGVRLDGGIHPWAYQVVG